MLRRLKFELLADELDGLGEHTGSKVEGAFDEARLAPHVAGDVEAGRPWPLRSARITSKPLIVA
jgi:hypothetical protein